jgi:hypothetical protein
MSLLKKVQKGRKLKPLAIMMHAPHGIGKSTFAAESPSPVYVGNEENDELDVPRFKIKTWEVDGKKSEAEQQLGLVNILESLLKEDHDYKTLVLDTVDGLEQIAEQFILNDPNQKGKTLATAFGGYGKGYEKLSNMFLNIRDKYLIPLRDQKGMNVVLLCHSSKVKHEEAMTLTSYDHYETALHKKVKGIFEDWVSAILFANYFLVRAETSSGKEYAEGADGLRMIYTEERPSHVAKNRFDMPYEIEFHKEGTWGVVRDHVLKHFKGAKKQAEKKGEEFSPAAMDLIGQIKDKLPKLPEELKVAVSSSFTRAKGNEKELTRILNKINGILA